MKSVNKKAIGIIFVVVVVAAGFLFYKNLSFQNKSLEPAGAPVPMEPQVAGETQTAEKPQTIEKPKVIPQKTGGDEVKIIYTDSGFSPNIITVKPGITAIFENKSDSPFWPAVNPHPVHTGYPTKGGCIRSTFDACRGIDPGSLWSFKFDIAGIWGYHDHLRPSNRGSITVE